MSDENVINDSLTNLVANLGTTKDKRYYADWNRKAFSREDLSRMYREDWLSGKIIDVPADDMTRNWRFYSSEDIDSKDLERVKVFERGLDVQNKFNESLKWARLYGGSAIVLGIDGVGEMHEPLEVERVREGSLKYLLVLDRHDLMPGLVNVTDPGREDFRRPTYYTIVNGSKRIHFSRVITFEGVSLPWVEKQRENYWGQSILQRVYDAVLNSQTAAQATSSLVYEAKIDVIKVKDLFSQIAAKGITAISERFQNADMIKSINNMLLIDQDHEEYEQKHMQFSGLSDLVQRFLNIAAAAADIPATRLLGESAPGLNATGIEQTRQYYDMVASQQETKLRAPLTYLDQIMVRSVLGDFPEDWEMTFNSLWQMTELEKADVGLKNAQRDQIHINNGTILPSMATMNLKEDGVYVIDNDFLEAVREIDKDDMMSNSEEEITIPTNQETEESNEIERPPEETIPTDKT